MKALVLARQGVGAGLGVPGECRWVETSSLVINLLFLGFAPGFRFKRGFANLPFLFRGGALRWLRWRGGSSGQCLWLCPLQRPRATGAGGSARPPELVQLYVCTNTFPFCQTVQRAIWIPMLYKKGFEAPLSDPSAVVSAIETQAGFGGALCSGLGLSSFSGATKRSWVRMSVPDVQRLLALTMLCENPQVQSSCGSIRFHR